jgi:hypothetical protein
MYKTHVKGITGIIKIVCVSQAPDLPTRLAGLQELCLSNREIGLIDLHLGL